MNAEDRKTIREQLIKIDYLKRAISKHLSELRFQVAGKVVSRRKCNLHLDVIRDYLDQIPKEKKVIEDLINQEAESSHE